MKIALCGVGLRSTTVLDYLRHDAPDLQVVGYFDPDPAFLDRLPQTPPQFNTIEDMLGQTQPDLLFVGSPNHAHLAQIKAGLAAGVRVFAEKPLVSSVEQSWELAELLQQYGPDRVIVGLVMRYSDHLADLRAAMARGQIGQVVSIEANEHICPGHGAFFMRDWRRHSALSGGFMLEKCCHDLDIYRAIAGARPLRVASFGGRDFFTPQNAPKDLTPILSYKKTPPGDVPANPYLAEGDLIDHQTAILEFENGVSMSFHTTLNAPDEQRRFCVFGTEGMAEGDFHRGYLRITGRDDAAPTLDKSYAIQGGEPGHYGADARMVRALIGHLRGEGALEVSAIEALEAGFVALALDEARVSRSIVDLSATWARLDALLRPSGAHPPIP